LSLTGRTHGLAGAAVGAMLTPAVPLAGMIAAGAAALAPDIDSPDSAMGRRLWPVSAAISGLVEHRGATHTVWFCAIVGVLAGAAARWFRLSIGPIAAAGFLGSLSHLVLDGLTVAGVGPLGSCPDIRAGGSGLMARWTTSQCSRFCF